jgi:RND family efflux transporter MFP subunit
MRALTRRRTAAVSAALVLLLLGAAAGWWRFGRSVEVRVETVGESVVAARVIGPGSVQARVPVTIAARVGATVATVDADVGDAVRAGQVLATLDDRDLAARRGVVSGQQQAMLRNVDAARASLARAQADLDLALARQRRDAQLLERGFVSAAVVDASNAASAGAKAGVEAARATLAAREADLRTLSQEARYADALWSYTRIVAPMDAVIVQRLAEPGTTVVPGTPLLKLVDPSTLWVAVRVDESVVGRVRPGQAASIRLRTGDVLPGRVARIARQSDAATRELDVHVAFETVPARFAIDQEAQVTIEVGEDRGLAVPIEALVRDRSGRQGVLVVEQGRTRFRPVTVHGGDAQQVLVRSGLSGGETVVAAAQDVRAGVRVRAAAIAAR